MAILKISAYKENGKYNFPSENSNPKDKQDKEWYLKHLQAMTHLYASNQCAVPFRNDISQNVVSIDTLRAYARGTQGSKMIKEKLLQQAKDGSGKFKTKMKDIFQTYDVLPEMFDVIRAINQRQDYDISASCVDYSGMEEKALTKAMMKFFLQKETKELFDRAQYKPNTPFTPEEMSQITEADVDMIFDSGGYLLQKELASIACCDETKNASGHKGIENKVNDDIITIGLAGIKTYVDRATNTIKYRYCDPKNMYLPYSQYMDFRDITKAGEYRQATISELVEINPNLTAEQIKDLVEGYAWMNPEYKSILENTGQYLDPNFLTQVDRCRVWIFDAQWLSVDKKTNLITKHSNGNDIVKDVKYDYELNSQEEKKGAKLKRTKTIKKYEAIWVVGSDILLSYGQAKDVAYYGKSGNKTPRIDYFFSQTGNMSLIQRCIPHVDDINLNTVKLRNAVATLPPAPRMVIQQQLLDNVFLNNIKQQPEDLIQTFVERGYLVVNGVDDHGRPVYQNSKAIEFMATNIVEDVNLFSGLIRDGINRIRQVLGLPEGLDGTAGNPYAGKGQTEMAAQASSNALYPSLSKISEIFNPALNDVVKKWQVYSKGKDLKVKYSPLNTTAKEILSLGAEFSEADIEIVMSLSPNDDQKQFLLAQLNEMSLQYTNSGGALGTSKAEYLMLYDMIMAGKIKLAMFKIAQIEKRRESLNEINKRKDQEFNIKSQQTSAVTTAEEQRKTISTEELEKRKTAVTVEAQKRKTAATTAYMKTFDTEGMPMPREIYDEIMRTADEEVMSTFASDGAEEQQQEMQQQGQEQMMPQNQDMSVMQG